MTDSMPDAITRLKTALEKARAESRAFDEGDLPDYEEAAWSAVSAAIEAVEGEMERLKADNAKLALKVKLPDDVEERLQRLGRVEWNGTIYYRDYEAYVDD